MCIWPWIQEGMQKKYLQTSQPYTAYSKKEITLPWHYHDTYPCHLNDMPQISSVSNEKNVDGWKSLFKHFSKCNRVICRGQVYEDEGIIYP